MSIKHLFIWSVAILSKTMLLATNSWTTPAAILASCDSSLTPVVKYDAHSNTAIAVWENSANHRIYASLFDGSTWHTATLLGSGQDPALDIMYNERLYAIAVWVDTTNSNALTYSAYDGCSWSREATLAGSVAANAGNEFVKVAISLGGPSIITYQSNESPNQAYAIHCTTSFGESWPTWETPQVRLSTMGTIAFAPSLSIQTQITGSYQALVVWQEGINHGGSIYGNDYLGGRGWGTKTELQTTPMESYIGTPHVTIDSSNYSGIAAWGYSTDGSTYVIHTVPFITDTWGTPATLPDSANSSTDLSTAAINSAAYIAIQDIEDTNKIKIYTGELSAGPTLSWSSTPVFTSTGAGSSPHIAIAATGTPTMMAYWSMASNQIGTVFYNGSSWGAEIDLTSANTASSPSVSIQYDPIGMATKGVGIWNALVDTDNLSYALFNMSLPSSPCLHQSEDSCRSFDRLYHRR